MNTNQMFKGNDGEIHLRTWREVVDKGEVQHEMTEKSLDQEDPEVKKFIRHLEDPNKYLAETLPTSHLNNREKYYAQRRLN